MLYLVTGGAGFIGGHLTRQLLQAGHSVVVLDNLSTGRKAVMIDPHADNPNFVFVNQDICDDVSAVFQQYSFDAVFHLAALARVQFSIDQPQKSNHANITGTLNILTTAKEHNVKRVIFSSSSSIFGDQPTLPVHEAMSPNYMSPYGLQKFTGEEYCRLFNVLYGMETISLRYFNVYGPEQNPEGQYAAFIPKFITMITNNIAPTIYGDGEQTRDFTFVEDVVRANILAAQTSNKNAYGQTFNIGGGENNSIVNITTTLLEWAHSDLQPKHADPVVESRHTKADISKAKEYLGWEPQWTFEKGLKKTFDYYKNK